MLACSNQMLLTVVDDMVVDLGRFSYISRPHCIIDVAATPIEPDVQQLFSSFQLPLEKGSHAYVT